jgi:hypothetical protein
MTSKLALFLFYYEASQESDERPEGAPPFSREATRNHRPAIAVPGGGVG